MWEFCAPGRDGVARTIYAATSGQTLLIQRTFAKKTEKTPRKEIDLALKRLEGAEHGPN